MRTKWVRVGTMAIVLLAVLVFGVLPRPALAACGAGADYRSATSGFWSDVSIWECYNGTSWEPATVTPDFNGGIITIRNGHTVTIANIVTVDQVTIDAGGQVTVGSTGTFSTTNGTGNELTINGIFLHSGSVPSTMNGTGLLGNGGTYIHNTTSSASRIGGFFGTNVDANSNFIFRGSSTLNTAVSFSGRTFGNLAFESSSGPWNPTSTSGGLTSTIKGNFSVGTTGAGIVSYNRHYSDLIDRFVADE